MVASFQDLDKDGLGFIKTRDLMNAFKFIGQAKTDKETANLMRKYDDDNCPFWHELLI